MNFEIRKLYKCSSHYLLIYPTKEKAAMRRTRIADPMRADTAVAVVATMANYWSRELNCKVHYSIPNEPFMVLKIGNKNKHNDLYLNVLFGDKIGWIVYNEEWVWIKIERIV